MLNSILVHEGPVSLQMWAVSRLLSFVFGTVPSIVVFYLKALFESMFIVHLNPSPPPPYPPPLLPPPPTCRFLQVLKNCLSSGHDPVCAVPCAAGAAHPALHHPQDHPARHDHSPAAVFHPAYDTSILYSCCLQRW
jgi:hypothetical protein